MDSMTYSSLSDVGQYSNWTGNNTYASHQSDIFVLGPYLIATVTLCVIGTVLNSLVIIVIVYGSLMRTSVFMILLLVLAVFDNLALWTVTFIQLRIINLFPLASLLWLCRILLFCFYTASNVSSWLIVLISAERTIAVFWPLKAHIYCTRRKLILVISMLIVMMCVVDLPLLFTSYVSTLSGKHGCHSFESGSVIETIYLLFLAFVYCIIPFCIISVLNVLTLRKIHSKRKFRVKHQTSRQGKSTSMNSSLTMTMFAVCIVFAVTTLPLRVMLIIPEISKLLGIDLITTNNTVIMIMYRLNLINHCINFLLYCLTGSVFRQTLICLLQSCSRRISPRNIQEPCLTVQAQVI